MVKTVKRKSPKDKKARMTPAKLERMIAKLTSRPASEVTRVKRTILGANRNGQNGVTSAFALYFTLNDLYDVADLTSNYDNYRFVKVVVEFRSYTPAVPSASTAPVCTLLAAVDLDDSNVPTLASISQYENVRIAGGHQSLRFSFEPRYTFAGDNGATNLIGLGLPGTWLDCAQPSVIHRGIKYFITASAAAQIPTWQLVIHYHLEFCRQR